MGGDFSADSFGDITNGEVNWICHLVTERGELGLVSGYNQGYNCSPWPAMLQRLLTRCVSIEN